MIFLVNRICTGIGTAEICYNEPGRTASARHLKDAGPLYSTKNVNFTKNLYYKVDIFAKTENLKNPHFKLQIFIL